MKNYLIFKKGLHPLLLLCETYMCPTIGWIIFPCFRYHLLYAQFLQLFSEESALSLHFQPLKIRYELQVAFAKIWANDLFELLLMGKTVWCFSDKYSGRACNCVKFQGFPWQSWNIFMLSSQPSFSPLLRTRLGSLIWFCGPGGAYSRRGERKRNLTTEFASSHVKTSFKHGIMCFASI